MSKSISKKALAYLLALFLVLAMFTGASISGSAAALSGYTSISTLSYGSGGYLITASGNYYLDSTITDATVFVRLPSIDTGYVTIAGDGIDAGSMRSTITIDCDAGTHLRLKDIFIKNSASGTSPEHGGVVVSGESIIRFIGEGNYLDVTGEVLLESTTYVSSAVIAVNAGTTLTITGDEDSVFYMYKYTQGCGIGADANNANGNININSGNIFIKGSKTGAIIGNDTCGDAAKEAQIGTITINGGNIQLATMSQGAAIGGSRMSIGCPVVINGGSLSILSDFTGSAIGAGAQKAAVPANNGTVTLGSGASLQVIRTGNSLYGDRTSTQFLNDTLVKDALFNANNAALRQCKIPVSGSSVTVMEADVTLYSGKNPTIYPYVGSTTSTLSNWDLSNPGTGYVYIYLTEEDHTVSVGETVYDCVWNGNGFDVEESM